MCVVVLWIVGCWVVFGGLRCCVVVVCGVLQCVFCCVVLCVGWRVLCCTVCFVLLCSHH